MLKNKIRFFIATIVILNGFGFIQDAQSQQCTTLQPTALSSSPYSFDQGDFTGDGYIDLVARFGASIRTLANSGLGDGVLIPSTSAAISNGTGKPASADFDHDGDLDIATINNITPYLVSVLKNDGTGTFGQGVDYVLSYYPLYISAANLNADQFPDLIVTTSSAAGVVVMLNHGDGTFAAGVPYGPFTNGAKMAMPADMNGDGKIDIVVGHFYQFITTLINNGNGTFTTGPRSSTEIGAELRHMTVGDLDGDNDPDVAFLVSNFDVSIMKNDGSGLCSIAGRYGTGSGSAVNVTRGFLNNDCYPDLSFANDANTWTSWINNNGSGEFLGQAGSLQVGNIQIQTEIADFDCNGYSDIAINPYLSDDLKLILMNRSCLPTLPCQTDTDGDGIPATCDQCPTDPLKGTPGICGCGIVDFNTDGDARVDCVDGCPLDPLKLMPGVCGCGVTDLDSDNDGTANCLDGCPNDPAKTQPGVCGCAVPDVDPDMDGRMSCVDNCPQHYNPVQEDCDNNGIGNICTIVQCGGPNSCSDCNGNWIPDACDITSGRSQDFNHDGRPDECLAPVPRVRWHEFFDKIFRVAPAVPEIIPRRPST